MTVTPNHSIGRRHFLAVAGTATAAAATGPLLGGRAAAASSLPSPSLPLPVPAPEPIPGGLDVGEGVVFHVFAPGPEGVVLPFSGFPLMGLDVEPNTITDFEGSVALAFVAGSATGTDGVTYNLESDLRAYQGRYIAADGVTREGSFGFI